MHDVVITGMGVVSPIGASAQEFEHNLFGGHNTCLVLEKPS